MEDLFDLPDQRLGLRCIAARLMRPRERDTPQDQNSAVPCLPALGYAFAQVVRGRLQLVPLAPEIAAPHIERAGRGQVLAARRDQVQRLSIGLVCLMQLPLSRCVWASSKVIMQAA